MKQKESFHFSDTIDIIGVNPYVVVPDQILEALFAQAGKKPAGPLPVCGKLNGHPFIQTVVKFSGLWRLYLNMPMRKAAGIDVGDRAEVELQFDPEPRDYPMHPRLAEALEQNEVAMAAFEKLSPSRQKEIVRYIAHLKSEERVAHNVARAIRFLCGEERFAGREKP